MIHETSVVKKVHFPSTSMVDAKKKQLYNRVDNFELMQKVANLVNSITLITLKSPKPMLKGKRQQRIEKWWWWCYTSKSEQIAGKNYSLR